MKVIERKKLDENRDFFKINDFVIHNEVFNIEVVAEINSSEYSVKRIETLNVEHDLSVSPEDVETYLLDKITENINEYLQENPIF